MKKLPVLVVPLAGLLFLSGCGGIKTTEEFAHEINNLDAVIMAVKESDPDSAVYTIENGSVQVMIPSSRHLRTILTFSSGFSSFFSDITMPPP